MEKDKELKEQITDEKTGISYTLNGDYYIPNLKLPIQEKIELNKYGRMRLDYLKKYKYVDYEIMFLENTLTKHLKDVQEQALKRVNEIMKHLK